jgi:hypothetical protein
VGEVFGLTDVLVQAIFVHEQVCSSHGKTYWGTSQNIVFLYVSILAAKFIDKKLKLCAAKFIDKSFDKKLKHTTYEYLHWTAKAHIVIGHSCLGCFHRWRTCKPLRHPVIFPGMAPVIVVDMPSLRCTITFHLRAPVAEFQTRNPSFSPPSISRHLPYLHDVRSISLIISPKIYGRNLQILLKKDLISVLTQYHLIFSQISCTSGTVRHVKTDGGGASGPTRRHAQR